MPTSVTSQPLDAGAGQDSAPVPHAALKQGIVPARAATAPAAHVGGRAGQWLDPGPSRGVLERGSVSRSPRSEPLSGAASLCGGRSLCNA